MQRYNDLSSYLKKKFGSRLLKLSIDGGFSCPNRKNGKKAANFAQKLEVENLPQKENQ